jgi:HEAT repeat protein
MTETAALIEQFDTRDYVTGRALAEQLMALGERAVESLVETLGDPDLPYMRKEWVRYILAQMGVAAFEPLVQALQHGDRLVRLRAIEIFPLMKNDRAVDALAGALHHPDRRTRLAAAEALANMGKTHISAIPMIADDHRDRAEELRKRLGEAGRAALLQAVESEDLNARTAAMWGACRLWPQAPLEVLLEALASGPPSVQARAAVALGPVRDSRVVEPLIRALRHPSSSVRASAAWSLTSVQDPRILEPLLHALNDPNPRVRSNAVWPLGNFQEPRVLEALLGALEDPSPGVRWRAAFALGRLGDPAAVPALVRALNHPDYRRGRICQTLGELGPSGVPPLVQALDDRPIAIGLEAATALVTQGHFALVMDFLLQAMGDPKPWVRSAARDLLRRIGQAAVSPLLHALGDADPVRRRTAALLLGEMKVAQAVDPLKRLRRDPDPYVRRNAIRALREMGVAA